jgi:hypothetical protein
MTIRRSMTNIDCSVVHTVSERIILAVEARIRIALQKGGYRRAEFVPLRDAAIGSLIEGLHNDAAYLSLRNYELDCRMGLDGNVDITASFGTEADMSLFRFAI